jgi:hypothetical protein
MNKFYYLLQCMTIVICSTCVVIVIVGMACSCKAAPRNHTNVKCVDSLSAKDYTWQNPQDVANDTDSVQLAICETLLNECAKYGVLDNNGKACYNNLKSRKSVNAYIELITECEKEEIFWDTLGGNDEWNDYVWHVLEPRGLAE